MVKVGEVVEVKVVDDRQVKGAHWVYIHEDAKDATVKETVVGGG
jgi:hypothetical protein